MGAGEDTGHTDLRHWLPPSWLQVHGLCPARLQPKHLFRVGKEEKESNSTRESHTRQLASPGRELQSDFNMATKDGHRALFPVLCYFLGDMARGGDLGRV